MRFGGHETFAIRDGWLHKGLKLIDENPRAFNDPFVADALGVGRNMAKSIRHWLQVTGLMALGKDDPSEPTVSDLGQLILSDDPYFVEIGTWWALHVHLVTQRDVAVVWPWFFNEFSHQRFDRSYCQEQLYRHLELNNPKQPRPKTLTRDLICMLGSYARQVPDETGDPEDSTDCPFRDLGLLTHYRDTGHYEVRRESKEIPPEMIGFCLSRTFCDNGATSFSVSLRDAQAGYGGPVRVFALSPKALVDTIQDAERLLGDEYISLTTLGGERFIHAKNISPNEWLKNYYKRIAQS